MIINYGIYLLIHTLNEVTECMGNNITHKKKTIGCSYLSIPYSHMTGTSCSERVPISSHAPSQAKQSCSPYSKNKFTTPPITSTLDLKWISKCKFLQDVVSHFEWYNLIIGNIPLNLNVIGGVVNFLFVYGLHDCLDRRCSNYIWVIHNFIAY